MDFYIYYRVKEINVAALQKCVRQMQNYLAKVCSITAMLKHQPDVRDGCLTWMEVYLAVPENFEMTLDKATSQFDLSRLIEGSRHTERFMDFDSCA